MNRKIRKTAALHNLGCKVNAYETEAMQQMLEEAGYEIVDFNEKADIYVVNTCSVTNMADRKSRQMLHRAKKKNPNSIVIAAGCYAQTKTNEARLDESVDILIGNNQKQNLIEAVYAYEKNKKQTESIVNINDKQPYETLSVNRTAEHTRAFIKVQDGCNQFCSYCIIPYARGRVRSRSFEEVLSEAGKLAENGYQELVLSGIHLSSYGIDRGENLLHLIQETANIKGIERIRLSSLEPRIVTEEFVSAISQIGKICPHFHLSLQSGCDETLQRMNRKYTTAEFLQSCELLRRYFSHPAITTDVIVGFPGETNQEFEKTKEFLRKVHFYEMHVFKYSKREGTKAASMPNQVPEQEKAVRSEQLISLANEMSEEFCSYYMGKEVEEYVKVAAETKTDVTNTFVRGTVSGQINGIYLMG